MPTTLNREEIADRVKKVVADVLQVERNNLTEESRFVEDLGADSLDRVTLLMALEEEFEDSIPEEKTNELTSIGAAINYIETIMHGTNA